MFDFDSKYEFRRAHVDEIPAVMQYINDDWREGHIMSRNRELFDYEFLDDDGDVNVVIALDKETGSIDGMIGYLYSSNTENKRDVWGSIWKVREKSVSLLGAEIMKRMESISGCRYNLGTGANPKTNIPIMRVMFQRTAGKMKHYYKLSSANIQDMKIARIVNMPDDKKDTSNQYRVLEIDDLDEYREFFEGDYCVNAVPYKDFWYVNKKFLQHPIYEYSLYAVVDNEDATRAIFVVRRQDANGKQCLRMVDYIGDFTAISHTTVFWDELIELPENENVEFVDFYCLGMADEDMAMAGFAVIADGDENIVPNYYSPFLQENIDIYVHYSEEGTRFTKADGDQDRPN